MDEGRFMGALDPKGPRVVAIGGGHGLSRSLGAIRRYASELTAIVSVADDGGSSGRLRESLGIAAPGDVRRCLGAMLSEDSALGRSLEFRFMSGELEGHAFGNLLIAALSAMTGDFVSGIEEAGRLLHTIGRVIPATTGPVVLKAEVSGTELKGQERIAATEGISWVSLVPPDAEVPRAAIDAIETADQIVIGPGSLFTSVLAALAPCPIATAVRLAKGRRTYVANLREQVPETSGFDVGMLVAALIAHGITPDVVCVDTSQIALGVLPENITVIHGPLSKRSGLVHDERLLAGALLASLG
jgi:uncharacterized cofD-like protein